MAIVHRKTSEKMGARHKMKTSFYLLESNVRFLEAESERTCKSKSQIINDALAAMQNDVFELIRETIQATIREELAAAKGSLPGDGR